MEKSGFINKIPVEKISLPVEGLTCASCVARVEKTISKAEGVKYVSVNLASEKATIEIEPGKADLAEIAARVEAAGYKLKIPEAKQENRSLLKDQNKSEIPEYEKKLTKDLLTAVVLTVPVVILNMGMMWHEFHQWIGISADYINKILLILTTLIVFLPGRRFFTIFWNNLKHRTADMNSLVAVGTGAAYIYSSFAVLFPELLSESGIITDVYFDTAAVIITLILTGRWLESRAKRKTGSAVKMLLSLKPKTASVKINGVEKHVSTEELKTGDIVLIRPGEGIPADGTIIKGSSTIDESMISGESIPVEKVKGSKVIGGTINKSGAFEFEITALGDNSILGKIIKMVEEAQGSKAPIQNIADRVASVFVPAVILIAAVTLIGWMITSGSFEKALVNFVSVLIIACPCALGLATPAAVMTGTGKGANLGILIKNGESLESAHKISTVIFDKTGTITEGKPQITNIIAPGISEDELLKSAASIEVNSEHPLGQTIVQYARKKNLTLNDTTSFEARPGYGINAEVNGLNAAAGNKRFMRELSVNTDFLSGEADKLSAEGKTVIFIAINNELKGLIALGDPVKTNSADAVKELKKMGIKTVMLTGDNKKAAAFVAAQTGIELFEAEVLPGHKAAIVSKYQGENEVVAMVGDGINDAPALAKSDVGIAIGSGTDIAVETGSIVLISGNPMDVVKAIRLSRETIKVIKQNLFWAFIYNILGIPLAVFGFLNPMFAALAMSLSSVSVLSNSLRLRNKRI